MILIEKKMKTYVFSGQGSQKVGMGEELFKEFPELVKKADNILGYSIEKLCLEDPDNQLSLTQFTQPALYVINALSYYSKIKREGVKPDFLAGHSLGEYSAILASGGFDFETGLKLVKKRGELMSLANGGSMAAIIGLSKSDIRNILDKSNLDTIDIANLNSQIQNVISGTLKDIELAKNVFEQEGARFVKLNVSAAFHSRYMKSASIEFEKYMQSCQFSNLEIPVISNVTAVPYRTTDLIPNLTKQLYSSVRWLETVEYLLEQDKDIIIEEVGPGKVLTNLGINIRKNYTLKSETDPVYNDVNTYIKDWNSKYPIGTKVTCKGYETELVTRTEAVLLFGHRAGVYMDGYYGYFDLTEIKPVE